MASGAPGGATPVSVLLPAAAPVMSVTVGLMWCRREVRRCSDPGRAQQLWDAIGAVRSQKQIPAITRMSRYMNRYYQVNKDETQRLLDAAVEDNLIKLERKVGTKGHKSGVEEKAYRRPTTDMLPRERHDWYCFHCHAGGEVLLCAGCHRVFHETCLKAEATAALAETSKKASAAAAREEEDDDLRQEWNCVTCRIAQRVPEEFNKKERKDLNHLLNLICLKMKNKLLNPILDREVPQPYSKGGVFDANKSGVSAALSPEIPGASGLVSPGAALTPVQQCLSPLDDPGPDAAKPEPKEDNTWRAVFLLKEQMTLEDMEAKCLSNQYRFLEEFRADAQLIVHNIVIYHGAHSTMADMARQMLRDCATDLREILQCRDCYRYANEHREKYWFCKPCRPFHDLVYAKQKGFPYWPAKVISTTRDGAHYEVRFFGGYHQKALVEIQHAKPISVNIHSLQVKRTSLWNKACEELRKHQELLAKCQQSESFLREPYGDPFIGGEIKNQLGGDGDSSHDSEGSDAEGGQPGNKGDVANVIAVAQQQQRPLQVAAAANAAVLVTPDGKKKKGKTKKPKKDESENFVSSSSQEMRFIHAGVQTQTKLLKKEEAATAGAGGKGSKGSNEDLRQVIEKMRAEFDQEKKRAVNVATRSLERDLERLKADHATEMEEMLENQKQELSDIKKKQWCYNCEAEAIYWCCWNTAYCSIECQQQHWHKEHKRNCRRKR